MGGHRLTRRQRDSYDRLRERRARALAPPTRDELRTALRPRSPRTLHEQAQGLMAVGLVGPMAGRRRGVRLGSPESRPASEVPLAGTIAAGVPIEAVEASEFVEIPARLRTDRPCYTLLVRGNSMVEDGILDGDWVIVEQREYARNGDIVVALIDGREATLKRIVQRPGEVILCPANSTMEPMVLAPERVQIQGVVVGQMRTYR